MIKSLLRRFLIKPKSSSSPSCFFREMNEMHKMQSAILTEDNENSEWCYYRGKGFQEFGRGFYGESLLAFERVLELGHSHEQEAAKEIQIIHKDLLSINLDIQSNPQIISPYYDPQNTFTPFEISLVGYPEFAFSSGQLRRNQLSPSWSIFGFGCLIHKKK